ncbi:hypothetical protein ACIBM3_30975 [Rhodococcus erythropolis]|uniref:hypothetical protein n=1 Tax=Rhodococcus erythropolis TaxID=1833 RepID=UPI0037A2B961
MTQNSSDIATDLADTPTQRKPWDNLESALRDIPEPRDNAELTRIEHAALASRVSILAIQPDTDDGRKFAYPSHIRETLQRTALIHATLAAASTNCFVDDPYYEERQQAATQRRAEEQTK